MHLFPLALISKALCSSRDTLFLYFAKIFVLLNDGAQGHLLQ